MMIFCYNFVPDFIQSEDVPYIGRAYFCHSDTYVSFSALVEYYEEENCKSLEFENLYFHDYFANKDIEFLRNLLELRCFRMLEKHLLSDANNESLKRLGAKLSSTPIYDESPFCFLSDLTKDDLNYLCQMKSLCNIS